MKYFLENEVDCKIIENKAESVKTNKFLIILPFLVKEKRNLILLIYVVI